MNNNVIYGLYGDDDILLKALKEILNKKLIVKEVYSPFPVHGLDKILGLKKTRISDMGFIYGVFGVILAVATTWFIMNHDWPQDIGGKPSFTWGKNMPAFIPIIFELTIFCSAHFMVITYLIRNKMYPGAKRKNPDPRTTDDKFLIEIEIDRDIDIITEILIKTGAEEISMRL